MRYSYPAPENAPNGTHPPPGMQINTHEMMPGQQHGPPPGHYAPPPPHSAGPPQTPIYGAPYYGPEVGFGQRRKPVRAAQACDSCRQRKAKCDEGRPICEHCKTNSLNCTYRDVQPPKQDKQVHQIYDKLENMSDILGKILAKQDGFSSRLDSHGRQLEQLQTLLPLDKRESSRYSGGTPGMSNSTPIVKQEQLSSGSGQQQSTTHQGNAQHLLDKLDADVDHDFALPPKHFTAAQNLMEWPSVKKILPENIAEKPTYVLELESRRGLIRLYGCGEGEDANDGREGPASPASQSSSSESRHDDESSVPSPNGVWGSGQLPARSTTSGFSGREHPGGIGPTGGLILDAQVIDMYFKEYMANIHILHPFLEAKVLRDMIHLFKRRYSWDFVPFSSRHTNTNKRKRDAEESPNSFDYHSASVPPRLQRRNPVEPVEIEHSIANAIVLLVMALGKICTHKGKLPGVPHPPNTSTSTPHNSFSDGLASSASAPSSPAHGRIAKLGEMQAAISSPTDPRGKNMDVIPGLAYFAQGADILGELPGGSSVSHVQANILAGLYMGQLARIIPAHYYFSNACRGCIVLIESSEYKRKEMKAGKRNLINFAFWSCLQLESDILAEVELPPSGITRYEGPMHQEFPRMVTLEPIPETSDMVAALRFYSYQITLRRELNRVHKALYVDKALDGVDMPVKSMQRVLENNLEGWRNTLGSWNWDEDYHKSYDINIARMRGKYYGAKYIIHRPTLAYALYHLSGNAPAERPSESPMGAPSSQQQSPAMSHTVTDTRYPRPGSERRPPSKIHELEGWVLDSAKTCVEAAIRSTTVFDAVKDRLIVTNIFGTAHAQFGNMLVLAATYKSDLSYLVKREILEALLDRTIVFLKFSEDISPTLHKDAQVLTKIRDNIFKEDNPQQSISTNSSFRG